MRQKNPNCGIVLRQTWVFQDSVEYEKTNAYNAAEQVAEALRTDSEDPGMVLIARDGKAMYAADAEGLSVFGDNTHQNAAGAYLCAYCIYKTLYQSPARNPYRAGLGDTADTLQAIADRVFTATVP